MPAQARRKSPADCGSPPVKPLATTSARTALLDRPCYIRDLRSPRTARKPRRARQQSSLSTVENFEPYYVVNPDKRKRSPNSSASSKRMTYLATDGDREGGPLRQNLKNPHLRYPVYRMTFPEITWEAIQRAFGESRIDLHLVDAQETRILDHIYGYEISPCSGARSAAISAGRVRSVAATRRWTNANAWHSS